MMWHASSLRAFIGLLLSVVSSVVSAVPTVAGTNLVPNPLFQGTGGTMQGTTGQVPDMWRAFVVGSGAAETTIVPLAAHSLYAGCPALNAVKLKVTDFGTDHGFDHVNAKFAVASDQSYHLEFYVKTGNTNGSNQKFKFGFPLFAGGVDLGRGPGGATHNLTATSTWTKVVGPTFSDAEATEAYVSFRLNSDGGENAILIALPVVGDPPDRFPPWGEADVAQRQMTWHTCNRLVGTTYFYWYRWPDQHFDGLTNHFVSPTTVSYLSKAWHKKELSDMIDAGIDMLWPVYWGAPGNFDTQMGNWSVYGLLPLQEAIDELQAEGQTPLKIGMFYDTTTLLYENRGLEPPDGKPDLTTEEGKELFYQTIRSFFATVHPKYWACIDGRPIVVLYVAYYAYAHNWSTFDYLKTHFAADFSGVTPYIIKEIGWHPPADSTYRWGAALYGPFTYGIAAVGPGFDNSAVSSDPRIRSRENGNYYSSGWQTVLESGQNIVHIETWNEMHEATEICESVEYGRQYIDLTSTYVIQFKVGFTKVTALSPPPGALLIAPPTVITVTFSVPIDPATVNASTFLLTGSGPDGVFDTADDASIAPASVSAVGVQAVFNLTGVNLPEQYYRVTLRGTGDGPIADLCGHALLGTFTGTFPSGADGAPGDFVSTFRLTHVFARADYDEDDDVDLSDFGHFQACLSDRGVPQMDPLCQNASLDGDSDVDQYDLDILVSCMSGSGVQADPNCAN